MSFNCPKCKTKIGTIANNTTYCECGYVSKLEEVMSGVEGAIDEPLEELTFKKYELVRFVDEV